MPLGMSAGFRSLTSPTCIVLISLLCDVIGAVLSWLPQPAAKEANAISANCLVTLSPHSARDRIRINTHQVRKRACKRLGNLRRVGVVKGSKICRRQSLGCERHH